jgi:hypothetical protein
MACPSHKKGASTGCSDNVYRFAVWFVFERCADLDRIAWALSHNAYNRCTDAEIATPEFEFLSLEHFFKNERKYISSYSNSIRTILADICDTDKASEKWTWTTCDEIINGVGSLPKLHSIGYNLLLEMVHCQHPQWCEMVATIIAEKLLCSCRTFARCHETHRLTVWSVTTFRELHEANSYHIELNNYFDQLTQELLTTLQQSLFIFDNIMRASFVTWVDPLSNVALATCTKAHFRQIQVAFCMIETKRATCAVHLGEDLIRKIFACLVAEDKAEIKCPPTLLRIPVCS